MLLVLPLAALPLEGSHSPAGRHCMELYLLFTFMV
jgi:hypothetical protein